MSDEELQSEAAPAAPANDALEVARAAKKKRSPFRSSRNFCAGHVEVEGVTFWYREISDPLNEWATKKYQEIADKLGISIEQFQREEFGAAKPEEFKNLPRYMEEAYTFLLTGDNTVPGCLVDWDATDDDDRPVPLTTANVADLAREVKADVVAQIRRSTSFGVSFNSFRQLSNRGDN